MKRIDHISNHFIYPGQHDLRELSTDYAEAPSPSYFSMDHVLALCNDATNHAAPVTPTEDRVTLMDRYALRLSRRKDRLFCAGADAAVSFWDLERGTDGERILVNWLKPLFGDVTDVVAALL